MASWQAADCYEWFSTSRPCWPSFSSDLIEGLSIRTTKHPACHDDISQHDASEPFRRSVSHQPGGLVIAPDAVVGEAGGDRGEALHQEVEHHARTRRQMAA